ncbi:hypothetical protein HXX02_05810 [Microbulbifer elongatus]|uniref:Uncharacterized protein n=1 Tax=Microbulbifer elongatus TaxID=86173 RepID=A0ABT1NYQ4_9GAMM|nr:hypothetical protein [Microbulbifer elongatus]MCQ3828951.1 hypothetical protein [Microbulbifer elongatus]
MNKAEVDNYCDSLPELVVDVPAEGMEIDMMLRPVEPENGTAQYWPFYEKCNPNELFGNMDFKFGGRGGKVVINLTLDLSAVPGRDLEFALSTNRKLDGILALSPDFKHQFKTTAKRVNGRYTELKIVIKDKENKPDNFNFLWLCEAVDGGMHFVSGDPRALIEPR